MRSWLSLILLAQAASAQTTPLFDFHSGFWVNLHHYLFEQASTAPAPPRVSPAWDAAVDYYRKEVIQRDLLSDEAARIDDSLSRLESGQWREDPAIPTGLASILQSAAPIYRDRWWTEHDRVNRAWIAAVTTLLAEHGTALKGRLAEIYATPWPTSPIRADVAEYANWAGAYTTLGPTHITISSANLAYRGDAGLEMLFHEASHALVAKLRSTLSDAARSQNRLYRSMDFWHAILFYTSGNLMQHRVQGYVPYAKKNGLYSRNWQGVDEILDRDWEPYLDGKFDLSTTVRRLVQSYGVDQ